MSIKTECRRLPSPLPKGPSPTSKQPSRILPATPSPPSRTRHSVSSSDGSSALTDIPLRQRKSHAVVSRHDLTRWPHHRQSRHGRRAADADWADLMSHRIATKTRFPPSNTTRRLSHRQTLLNSMPVELPTAAIGTEVLTLITGASA